MVTPFGRPETINTYSDQSVHRSQRSSVVDYDPYAAQGPPERPVPDQNVHRIQRHRNDTDNKVCDGLVDYEDDEIGVKFLLVLVRQENEKVGHGADGCKDEKNRGDDDHRCADVAAW